MIILKILTALILGYVYNRRYFKNEQTCDDVD